MTTHRSETLLEEMECGDDGSGIQKYFLATSPANSSHGQNKYEESEPDQKFDHLSEYDNEAALLKSQDSREHKDTMQAEREPENVDPNIYDTSLSLRDKPPGQVSDNTLSSRLRQLGGGSRSRAFSSIGDRSDLSCFADAEDFRSCAESKRSREGQARAPFATPINGSSLDAGSADMPFQTASSNTRTQPLSLKTQQSVLLKLCNLDLDLEIAGAEKADVSTQIAQIASTAVGTQIEQTPTAEFGSQCLIKELSSSVGVMTRIIEMSSASSQSAAASLQDRGS